MSCIKWSTKLFNDDCLLSDLTCNELTALKKAVVQESLRASDNGSNTLSH